MPPRRVDDPAELAWLGAEDDNGWCGYYRSGWDATTWVLNAMYSNPSPTQDDRAERRSSISFGGVSPGLVNGVELGMTSRPEAWQRIRWSDYIGAGFGEGRRYPPCAHWFPDGFGFPPSIAPPCEGSLDHESLDGLLAAIASVSPDGSTTECFAYFGGGPLLNEGSESGLWRCRLSEIPELVAATGGVVEDPRGRTFSGFSPSNFWPIDRSWFVYTDYDLWGTEVSGSPELIAAVEAHQDLETVHWDWPRRPGLADD
ncbi:hypothetical protein TSST111916_19965 [Tsukamurella strandjordii]|uniref:hypothetical protein n=1 Tax=Tsukamurella TaxID=2060 RepID=UPI001C7D1541|nr:hypothetical protein [Tsukamurella sp. TY48]GIZ98472.1 hypothetical protein TTY48_30840 [Tsukamurella sp. TY48]